MNIQLTQKETMFLKDLKSQEEMCIKKYSAYSNQAKDPQLKQLFKELETQEQQHLDSINQLLAGQIPSTGQGGQSQGQGQQMSSGSGSQDQAQGQMSSGQQQGQQMSSGQQGMQQSNQSLSSFNKNASDKDMCQDLLSTEKHVSGTYDTAIFEFTNANARQVLNHIQKEEQQHGEKIFNYMNQNGMYQVQ